MRSIESMPGEAQRPGDIGWVVERHGALDTSEYGWDERFEGSWRGSRVSSSSATIPGASDAWVAERDGDRIGCVFLVQGTRRVARLRLLLVEPAARGLGLGARLVDGCVEFARCAGYRTVTLWTQSILGAARRIYQRCGFRLVRKEPHHSFGHDLVGETWELDLRRRD